MPPTNGGPPHDPLETIVATLTSRGPRPAGKLAEQMGIPYSTLTPRLRQLEADGRAERVTDATSRITLWQATATVSPTPAAAPQPAADSDGDDLHDDGCAEAADDSDTRPVDPARGDGGVPAADAATVAPVDEPPPGAADVDSGEARAPRRRKGAIPAAILEVTRAHPDTTFTVSQLRKALDGISAGAIANAAAKLVVAGELQLVCEKPVTVQAA